MTADYGPAKWIGTSHYWKGRQGHTPKWVIVHGTAGGTSADAVGKYFQTNDPPTSTHFVVGLNGEVVQCVLESDSAWGNGIVTTGHDSWWTSKVNPNFLTFSIEHVKPSTSNSSQLTAAQKKASFELIKHLCQKHNIPMKMADAHGGITGHRSIDPVNKSFCPGPYPWDELIAYLNSGSTSGGGSGSGSGSGTSGSGGSGLGDIVNNPQSSKAVVPSGWKDDGKTLTAPNGKQVVLGFRWYVLNHKWDADDWPLESEHSASVVDITNPNPKSGTVQSFRKSVLIWEKETNFMYEAWAGSLALAWQQRAASAASSSANSSTSNVMTTSDAPYSVSPQTLMAASVGSGGGDFSTLTYIPPNVDGGSGNMAGAVAGAASVAVATATATDDPITQRLSGLEQQMQVLVQQLTGNANGTPASLLQGLEVGAVDILDPKKRNKFFSDPGKILRWCLMILGLLFSDAVAWIISAVAHHQMTLPLPFLTVGAVVSVLTFLSAFRIRS